MSRPPVLYAAASPARTLLPGSVVLYKHTWEHHIELGHPDVDFGHVRDTMSDPCYLCVSATTPGSFVMVSEQKTNEFGDVLRVPVKPIDGVNVVTTSYYSAASSHGTVVWRRGDD